MGVVLKLCFPVVDATICTIVSVSLPLASTPCFTAGGRSQGVLIGTASSLSDLIIDTTAASASMGGIYINGGVPRPGTPFSDTSVSDNSQWIVATVEGGLKMVQVVLRIINGSAFACPTMNRYTTSSFQAELYGLTAPIVNAGWSGGTQIGDYQVVSMGSPSFASRHHPRRRHRQR